MLNGKRIYAFVFAVGLIFFSLSCGGGDSVIFDEEGETAEMSWTSDELARDIAVKPLRRNAESSYHLIRLQGKESPHVHESHDLVVFMRKGRARVYLKNRWLEMRRGDIIEIPRGILHWAENAASGPSEVYAVFSPPLDAPDTVLRPFPHKEAER